MRDLFPGYYDRTVDELSSLWQEGVFIFDTNMLLHIYEYSQATRDRFFETLSKLKDRIWIPYQVASEYQRRRMKVIMSQKNSYKLVTKQLDKMLQALKEALEPYRKDKHAFIDTQELIKRIAQEFDAAKSELQKAGGKHPDYKVNDPLRENLDTLFAGKIGDPYSHEMLREKLKEAQYRLENQIPPGFEDEDKGIRDRYGDIILWFQLIDYAQLSKKPVIFITDDVKKDWWIQQDESYGKRKPRPELTQEMYLETGILFHMYEGYDFMDEAQKYLKLEEKPEVIEEIKEIGQQDMKNNIVSASSDTSGYSQQNASLSGISYKLLQDTIHSPAYKFAQDYINSPAYKFATDYFNSPSFRIAQDFANSPSVRMARDVINTTRHLRELASFAADSIIDDTSEEQEDDTNHNNDQGT